MSAVLGLRDLFQIANEHSRRYSGPQLVVTDVKKGKGLASSVESFDAVILPPNLSGARGVNEAVIHEWLKSQHAGGAMLGSVCVGAFWLGHSGLLNGRPVTTHWAVAEEFQETFPSAHLDVEQILVDDNDIVTAGGLMAWLDLGLYIVDRWLGPQVVTDTARHLLIDPNGREQRCYRTFRPRLNHGDMQILSIQHWLESRVDADITVSGLALEASLSLRTFLRRFSAATGLTPISYIQQLRIEKARALLEHSRIPISEIAFQVGYQDASAFSRLFRSTTGLTAGEYRNRFGIRSRIAR